MVTGLHIGDALTDRLDDTSTLVSQNDGESALGVFSGQSVGIRVADTGVVDLNADLMGLGRGDLDILDAEVLAGFPGNGRLGRCQYACRGRGTCGLAAVRLSRGKSDAVEVKLVYRTTRSGHRSSSQPWKPQDGRRPGGGYGPCT